MRVQLFLGRLDELFLDLNRCVVDHHIEPTEDLDCLSTSAFTSVSRDTSACT
jgi:hypothetical protein